MTGQEKGDLLSQVAAKYRDHEIAHWFGSPSEQNVSPH